MLILLDLESSSIFIQDDTTNEDIAKFHLMMEQ